ncbi:MAG: GNAT family N-acetyltransferase [Marinirhabdus sp.]|nr:GNAT family N-acetyltransferase [Marinirhabdus sp.]
MQIAHFQQKYANAFYDLNVEWLERFFYVEPYDREVLSNPEKYIISQGGHIFLALENDNVIGTVALLHRGSQEFELTKMAVHPEERGKGTGKKLLEHCIYFAKEQHFKRLYLYSHTKLENAIHLYRTFGFEEITLEFPNPYERSNIKMEYQL